MGSDVKITSFSHGLTLPPIYRRRQTHGAIAGNFMKEGHAIMTSIQFLQQPPKEKKSDYVNTAFGYFPASKPSPYTREGKALTWVEVQSLVSDIMKERGIVATSTADLSKKLPALIFALVSEIDDLQAKIAKKK
jgi:hypothetical protein